MMKKIAFSLLFILLTASAQEEYLYDMGDTVGYIKDNKGNKYLVVETKTGAKLVKVKDNPENLLQEKLGITKDDLKLGGEGK